MHYRIAATSALLFSFSLLQAQTFTAGGGAIPDDGSALLLPITVNGLTPATIDSLVFGLESTCINVQHERLADLDIALVAPDGTTAQLTGFNGSDGQAYTNTCFRADATVPISSGSAPFTGTYLPQRPMGLVNNGQNGNGTWMLRVHDANNGSNTGHVLGWSITFGSAPANFFHLASSNLPIVVIDTDNEEIPDDPKIHGWMGIINNGEGVRNRITDPFTDYAGNIGIERRGNTSQTFPKKSYGIELRDFLDSAFDASLLGMPEESDWVLSASYSDKSLLNNVLAYDLGRHMGHYTPRWRHVEVVLNGEYIGVYVFTEKIKRDAGRLDIAKLRPVDISGDDRTGGYILKLDWATGSVGGGWTSAYAPAVHPNGQTIKFLYEYPSTPQPEQEVYIQAYVDSFETALAGPDFTDEALGYRRFAHAGSFVDLFLINELSRNVDGYRLSTFLHKDKDSRGGKLRMGPLWDYDIAWGNANYCNGNDPTSWAYAFGDACPNDIQQVPFWWARLLEDPRFVSDVRCRWNELRMDLFSTDRLHAWCDSMAQQLDEAQQRNFISWPILGTTIWPNPQPVPTTYAAELDELKGFIAARAAWMDANLPGTCTATGGPEHYLLSGLRAWPNPFTTRLTVELPRIPRGTARMSLLDAAGRLVAQVAFAPGELRARSVQLDVPASLSPGVYLLRSEMDGAASSVRVLRMD